MKLRPKLHAHDRPRSPAAKALKLALFAAALLAASVASGEGGGDPIADQAGAVRAQREAKALGRQSDYEAAFARAHPGDPGNTVHGERAAGQYANRSSQPRDRSYQQYDRSYHYSDRGHRYYGPRSHEYAYASPYYYDPAPSPGISLFFNF